MKIDKLEKENKDEDEGDKEETKSEIDIRNDENTKYDKKTVIPEIEGRKNIISSDERWKN